MNLCRAPSVESYPPVPVFSWMGVLSPLILIPAALPVFALYFAPSDVLEVAPALKAFTDWMVRLIPHMKGHADGTQIPQVAALVDCLVIACSAFIALVVCVQSAVNYRYLLHRHVALGPHPLRTYAPAVLGAPFVMAMLAAMVMIPGDPSWAKGATQNRTLMYGFLALIMPCGAGLVIGGTPLMVRLFLDAYLFSRPVTINETFGGEL